MIENYTDEEIFEMRKSLLVTLEEAYLFRVTENNLSSSFGFSVTTYFTVYYQEKHPFIFTPNEFALFFFSDGDLGVYSKDTKIYEKMIPHDLHLIVSSYVNSQKATDPKFWVKFKDLNSACIPFSAETYFHIRNLLLNPQNRLYTFEDRAWDEEKRNLL